MCSCLPVKVLLIHYVANLGTRPLSPLDDEGVHFHSFSGAQIQSLRAKPEPDFLSYQAEKSFLQGTRDPKEKETFSAW